MTSDALHSFRSGVWRRSHKRVATERRQVVQPNPDGGWDVLTPTGGTALSHHATGDQAEIWTRIILLQSGGGTVVVRNALGETLRSVRVESVQDLEFGPSVFADENASPAE